MSKIPVIVDSREQKPWALASSTMTTTTQALSTGDYTIEGMEDVVCVERKQSVAEIAKNITEERFVRELERMTHIRHRFILCEFSMSDIMGYPYNTRLPRYIKRKIKIRGKYILSCLVKYVRTYGVHIVLCDNRTAARNLGIQILEKVYGYERNARVCELPGTIHCLPYSLSNVDDKSTMLDEMIFGNHFQILCGNEKNALVLEEKLDG